MPREEYQQSLASLQANVLRMGDLVLERFEQAVRALRERDRASARRVVAGDDEVNDLYLELEKECIDLIALQQPVASDLRFIAASFKVITDLERIADLATNLGEYTLNAERDLYPDVDTQGIGEAVGNMVERAMDAYAEDDGDACFDIAAFDDDIDAMCERASTVVVRELIETEVTDDTTEDEVENLMQDVSRLLLTIRDLERVGDHAVNIAARTLYMVENDDGLIY
jgi:phosphate transport system protein